MAKINESTPADSPPLVELTAEARKHIEGLEVEITRVEGDLKAMQDLGLDTSKLQVHLDFAKKARLVILDRFT